MRKSPRSRALTASVLERHGLPVPGSDADKEARGRVLVVGGHVSLPGAVVLAGIAALRAGAGKLQLATCSSIATQIGVAVPEAMSIGLRETKDGTIHPGSGRVLQDDVAEADAVLIGPGTKPHRNNVLLVQALLDIPSKAAVVLDAAALEVLKQEPAALARRDGHAVVTPHAAEMSLALGIEESEVEENFPDTALHAAGLFGCVVALKGPSTFIASPAGELFRYESGDVGLATSGSGDTLAGIVTGLLARGTDPLAAALWAVYLHGEAGNILKARVGRIGYLARELLDEIPRLMP